MTENNTVEPSGDNVNDPRRPNFHNISGVSTPPDFSSSVNWLLNSGEGSVDPGVCCLQEAINSNGRKANGMRYFFIIVLFQIME